MSKHTLSELMSMQAAPLEVKIMMTKSRIRDWVREFGTDGVYVSFSGGKDSTVLLTIVREMYPEIPAVFCDTGLEFPEIRQFVKSWDNVTWIKPKMNFRKVIETYGYPMISKETSEASRNARRAFKRLIDKGIVNEQDINELKFDETVEYIQEHYESIKNRTGLCKMLGILDINNIPDKRLYNSNSKQKASRFNCRKWLFTVKAPFQISEQCCNIMKKRPFHKYEKETGRKAIVGSMACESRLRKQKWLQHGCNAFDAKKQTSNPMMFWTEQDVLQYIKQNNIPIASVYGEVIPMVHQITAHDELPKLKTIGIDRTGCMFCGFGCHLEKPGEGRFERLKETHPKLYDYIMRDWNDGGLGYKNVIDWMNDNGGLNIKY